MYTELDSTCVYMYMYELIMSVAMCILNLTVHVYNYMYMYEVIMFVCAYRYHTLSVARLMHLVGTPVIVDDKPSVVTYCGHGCDE